MARDRIQRREQKEEYFKGKLRKNKICCLSRRTPRDFKDLKDPRDLSGGGLKSLAFAAALLFLDICGLSFILAHYLFL